jgi:hypothetical protein
MIAHPKRKLLWGVPMPTHRVNLDALIRREDLDVQSPNSADRPGGDVHNINMVELEQGRSMFDVLRKPDFQRETSEWTPEQIVELVKDILDDELVPAVIVWKAANRNVFVIDGAHRLSALIAWVNDDYGDGNISLKFYGGIEGIPKAQIAAAKETKALIENEIGSYTSLSKFRGDERGATPLQIRRAKNVASISIITQSVRNDAKHAEASFYRINQGGAVIDETEKEIIHARRRPEALAARALLRAGTGHRYWWAFGTEVKAQIESLAKASYETLYRPEIQERFRTLELPMAGGGYSADALAVLFEFIHIANGLQRTVTKSSKAKQKKLEPLALEDPRRDKDGSVTIQYLKRIKSLAEQITSEASGSLGLHPAVYSYSATGKFQPTAFFAQIQLVMHLDKHDQFAEFTVVRCQFEEFLVTYKYFINQLIVAHGAKTRSLTPVTELYLLILAEIQSGNTNEDVKATVLKDPRFATRLKEITPGQNLSSQRFSTEAKAAIRLRDALRAAPVCKICKARYHPNSTSIDHRQEVRHGGLGSMNNGDVTHPYCNHSRVKLASFGMTSA